MVITVELPPEVESKIKTQISDTDFKAEVYVQTLIKEGFERRGKIEKMSEETLDEVLAPLRKNFADSGMTEEELDELVENERQAIWEEKHGQQS